MCTPTKEDLNGWNLIKMIGEGKTATVWRTCFCCDEGLPRGSSVCSKSTQDGKRTVVKIIPFAGITASSSRSKLSVAKLRIAKSKFEKQTKLATQSGVRGLGPLVIDTWTTDRYGFIVMEEWDVTLAEWKRKHKILHSIKHHLEPSIHAKLKLVKQQARRLGHNDVHAGNIVLRLDPKHPEHILDIGVIDWDKVISIPDQK